MLSSYSYSFTDAHMEAAQYYYSLVLFNSGFEAKSSPWHGQPPVEETVQIGELET